MEKIEITFLGTGSTIPTVSRNHSGIYVKYKDRDILVDCGEGTQRQMRKAKLNICKITDILITHIHGDHVFGLPGLFHSLHKNGYKGVLNIYGPRGTKEFVGKLKEISTRAKDIQIEVHEVSGKFIDNPYFEVHALSLEHDIPTNGYMFIEKDRRRIDKKKLKKVLKGLDKKGMERLGGLNKGKDVKIGGKVLKAKDLTYVEKGRKVSFIFDSRACENVKKLAKDSDLAIMDSTFLESDEKGKELLKRYKHMSVEGACKIGKSEKVKKLILTHFSQRYEFREKMLLKEAKKIFKNVELAKDLMRVGV